jgi:hypothetical protein
MKKQLITLGLLLVMVITSIAQTNQVLTLNANSEAELKASMEKIVATMNEDEKEQFVDAFMFTVMGKMFEDASDEEVYKYLDGKTAKELIEDVNKAQAKLTEKRRDQAKVELAELNKKKSEGIKQQEVLKKIEILDYEIVKVEAYGKQFPALNATIVNKTEIPIYEIYITINILNTDKSEIVKSYQVSHRIDEHLNPGKETTFKENFRMFNGSPDEIFDAINIDVKVTEIKDEKWKTLYDYNYFTKRDREKEEKILKEYPEYK